MSKLDKNIRALLTVVFALSFFAFGWLSNSAYEPGKKIEKSTVLDEIRKTKTLNVVLLNAPSTYYIGVEGAQGFEYDLLSAYAEHLGAKLNITTASTIKDAIRLSKLPHIHITSASLAKTKERETKFNFGPSYFEVQEQVVCNRDMIARGNFPRNIEDLAGLRIRVGEETSYSETIVSLQADGFDINASFDAELSTEELLEQVASNEIDCTLADSNIYALNQRYMSQIESAFTISAREQLAWVLAPNSKKLEADMYSWLNSFQQSGKLAQLKDHYYSYVLFFDYYDNTMFYKRVKSRLPTYKDYFVKYGEMYAIPWRLLAAQSYQESHWNPNAKSFTGVRGLMMLTLTTAKSLGVEDRLDPRESIEGGTRHLKQMLKNVPEEVEGEDRLKFALAAYNVGMGHIVDAQTLAVKIGLNKNIWSDLKKVLPLLSQKKYYKTLKHGYARGSEPVRYVDSIYDYKDILQNINEEIKETPDQNIEEIKVTKELKIEDKVKEKQEQKIEEVKVTKIDENAKQEQKKDEVKVTKEVKVEDKVKEKQRQINGEIKVTKELKKDDKANEPKELKKEEVK